MKKLQNDNVTPLQELLSEEQQFGVKPEPYDLKPEEPENLTGESLKRE